MIEQLRTTGRPFNESFDTLNGELVEIAGRTHGGIALVRFSHLGGLRVTLKTIEAEHAEAIATVETMQTLFDTAPAPTWLRGEVTAPIPVTMNGATYMADLTGGQKTGLFYDQRPNHAFAARLAQVEIDLMAMATSNMRIISKAAAGQAPGVESSMLKVKGTIIRQELNDLARRAVGPYAMPFPSETVEGDNDPIGPEYAAPVSAAYFNNRKLSIFGGSNEIQRQIIAKTTLGGAK